MTDPAGNSEPLDWQEFTRVELRVGTVTRCEPFAEARRPAYKLWIDFGPQIGEKKSSAQITANYLPEELVGTQVVAVVNFPPKQVGPFMSEVLVTGFEDENGAIVLTRPAGRVSDGARLI